MFKKLISILLTIIFLLSHPLEVLAQVDWPETFENPAASGPGFFLYNANQAKNEGARYLLRAAQGDLWVTEDAIWLTHWQDTEILLKEGTNPQQNRSGVHLKITFPAASTGVRLQPEQPMEGRISFLTGQSPADWQSDLPLWGLLRYHDLYPGVDLVIRSTAQGFDWQYQLQEGADVSKLHLRVEGGIGLQDEPFGSVLKTAAGDLYLPPLALAGQVPENLAIVTKTTAADSGSLEIYPQTAGFTEPKFLDPNAKLAFSTFLGGAQSDEATSIAVDALGNTYLVGTTTSPDFPVTTGAFDGTFFQTDGFVIKIDPDGQNLIYATFIGGDGTEKASSIAIENGIAYIGGETDSPDFPIAGAAIMQDAFVVALNAAGNGLNYAKLISGSEDERGYGLDVENGAAYLTGITFSSDFPVTNSSNYKNNGDVFIVKLNSNGTTTYATLVGGSQLDAGNGLAVRSGIAWITGETSSGNFGGTFRGETDVFVINLTAAGMIETTRLFGGRTDDRGFDLTLDGAGDIYVTGYTNSADFPLTEGSWAGSYDAFILKLSPTAILYAAFLGGSGTDQGFGIALDGIGGVVVTGFTQSDNFPVTADAFQPARGGSGDAFVTRFFLAGSDPGHRSYSTYLGGSGSDRALSLQMHNTIYAYLVGDTSSSNFPTTADGLYQTLNGTQDTFFSVLAVGPLPVISIQKTTNLMDVNEPSALYIPVGDPVAWQYNVHNQGELTLTNIQVTDNRGVAVSCPFTYLDPGGSMQCEASGLAIPGPYSNLGTVTASTPYGSTIGNVDASFYFGADPKTTLVKKTNHVTVEQPSELYIEQGAPVTWTYEVTNNGNVDLTYVVVVDDNGTPANTGDDVLICTIDLLPAGTTDTTTCSKTGEAVAGQYTNIAVVVGTPPGGLADVSDDDPSSYFGSAPAITLEKWINDTHVTDAPGPYLLPGDDITWDYYLKNTGNVTLTAVSVVDDLEGAITCPGTTLAPLETMTCTLLTTVTTAGPYHNTATVTATPPVGSNVSAMDDSFYFGAQPAVALEFLVNDVFADSEPGLYVLAPGTLNLEYQLTNSGNVPLTNLVVSDPSGQVCSIANLAVGASDSCARTTTTLTGQQSMLASVTATPPAPLGNVTANDYIYYFGSDPSMTMVKQTNGQDGATAPGVYVLTGSTVNWTYTVTNDGNVPLSNLTVVDDNGTPGDLSDDKIPVGCSNISLNPGANVVCTLSDTAGEGQYTNNADANGNPPAPLLAIKANDTSRYFGTTLNVTLVKQTNDFDAEEAPGPLLVVGAAVNWTYTVTNNSNVAVDIAVVDDPIVAITCPVYSLGIGGSTICTASGVAIAGQYTNTATLTATPPGDLNPVSAEDTSHYFGVTTGVTLVKSTNGQDADIAPGPIIKIGEPVTWTYLVTNTGNVALTGIAVTDDQGVTVSCPGATLAAFAQMSCTASGTAVAGQYANTGLVTANPPVGFNQVSASDTSHYFGGNAAVDIEKLTNGVDAASAAEGPFIRVGQPVTWSYQVTNTGNMTLVNIVVTDSQAGIIVNCPLISELLPAESTTCSAAGFAIEGQYANIGYVSADVQGLEGSVYDQDTSWYFGANPSIQIVKKTNGQDANDPPGPYIAIGETVDYSYEITNSGAFDLTNIEVNDDAGVIPACSHASLPSGEVINCQSSGVALIGQHVTGGNVQATAEMDLGQVSASDESHYFGYSLDLELLKYTNGTHVSAAPGPNLVIGEPVTWTYQVKNQSNVQLVEVGVTDDTDVTVTCPKTTLAPEETMTCAASGTVTAGQYNNVGRAAGWFNGDTVQASDVSYYFGVLYHYIYLPLLLR